MRALFALLAILNAGCTNDLDALYGDGGAPASQAIPLLPALPDEGRRDACEACAAEKCMDTYLDCLADDDCADMLRCKSKCDDPACLLDCQAGRSLSAWYDDHWGCVFGGCSDECRTGDNWACVGNFDWTEAEEPRFDVHYQFDRSTGPDRGLPVAEWFVGAQVTAKAINFDGTQFPLDTGEVTADGNVTLEIDVSTLGSHVLDIDGSDLGQEGFQDRFYLPPLAAESALRVAMLPWRPVLGAAVDRSLARMLVHLRDCTGERAPNTTVDLVDYPDQPAQYLDASAGLVQDANPTGSAAFVDLPDSAVGAGVTIRAARLGEPVAERRGIRLRAGGTTVLRLDPRSRR